MRPLLWKEMRDLRAWIVAGAAFLGAVELLTSSPQFRSSFEGAYLPFLVPLLLTIAAVALAAGQIARERQNRTLDYLLSRPISPAAVVWTKFLAGSVALVPLAAGIVGIGYFHPELTRDTAARAVQEQVAYPTLLMILFPRYWCVYALALLVSELVDRAAKVSALIAVTAVTLIALVNTVTPLEPFSRFVYWLPYIDRTGGLVLAAKDESISWLTGSVFCAVAIGIAGIASVLLHRSPESRVGNVGLTAIATGMVAAAVLSAHTLGARIPVVHPEGSIDVVDAESGFPRVLANSKWAAVASGASLQFFDFSEPGHPKRVSDVTIPFWTSESDWYVRRAAMAGDTVYMTGKKKTLPVDLEEIAIVRPSGFPVEIILGPERKNDYVALPTVSDGFLYLATTREGECTLRVFDIQSRQETASLLLDKLPRFPERPEGPTLITACQRGSYVYVAAPASLIAVDLRTPGRPVIAGRLPYRPKVSFLYGYPRMLVSAGDRLFQLDLWPESLGAFDLSDPGHPWQLADFARHDDAAIVGSDHALYQPWRQGVLEFHAEGDSLREDRYLSGGDHVEGIAVGEDYVYALTSAEPGQKRHLQAFRRR